MQKYSGCGSEPGRAACGSRSDGPRAPAAEPCLPSRAPGPGRGAGRLRTGLGERLRGGAAGTSDGHKHLSRRPHPRPARSSADTKLARVSIHSSPRITNKTGRKISDEAPALKMRRKHLRLEMSILPLSVQCVDSGF